MDPSNIILWGSLPGCEAATDESYGLGEQTQQNAKEDHILHLIVAPQFLVEIRLVPFHQILDQKATKWPSDEAAEQGHRREKIPGMDVHNRHCDSKGCGSVQPELSKLPTVQVRMVVFRFISTNAQDMTKPTVWCQNRQVIAECEIFGISVMLARAVYHPQEKQP